MNTNCVIIGLLTVGFLGQIQAIPAFARKYNQTCNLCHVSIPKLNTFGNGFRNNGYRFPKETPDLLDEEPIKLGGKVQKKLWPKQSIWPGNIPGTVPIVVRTMLDFNINPDEKVKSDFESPHEIEIISAGNLGESISFLVELAVYEDGGFGGLERAFLQFDSPNQMSKLLNIKIGQFETAAVSFTRIRRITMQDYLTSSFRNGNNPFRFKDRQIGLEIWGIKDGDKGGGLYYGAGIVNGNGTNFTGEQTDNNSAKDFYGRLSYKIGGLSLSGESGVISQGGNWRDDSFQIGSFGYWGKGLESDFQRYGFDFRWQCKDLDLFGAVMAGSDKFNDSLETEESFSAYFMEANYVILPWVIGALRTEFSFTPDNDTIDDIGRFVGNVSFSIRPNVVFRIELVKDFTGLKTFNTKMRFDFAL